MSTEHELMALSPLDGRYANRTRDLSEYVSEYGLIRYRVKVEVEWLRTLASGILPDVEKFTPDMDDTVSGLAVDFSVDDAVRIKEIESTTNHDVKAVEMWLREKLAEAGGSDDYLELVHFGRTSEDINNLAYGLMLKDVRDKVLLPNVDSIGLDLEAKAHEYAEIPLLSKTHGQPATPTTLGKEIAVFVERVNGVTKQISNIPITGKINGATGTHSADLVAYPDIDWQEVSKDFVEGLGLTHLGTTTQIEPHDNQARLLNEFALSNTQLIDLSRDIWQYISDGVFKQSVVKGEVGSSTMPHKVNPIDFENAEANFGLANALAIHLATKLPISRLQRDLTDSSAQRAFGEVFGHGLVAYKSLLKGLSKITPNTQQMAELIDDEWPVLTEALQTVMRRHNVPNAYDIIKEASRGKEFNKGAYVGIVEGLDIPKEDKDRLLKLTPANYTGAAAEIARKVKYRGQ